MAISGSSTNVATIGPTQGIATAPCDLAAAGPHGETSGNALVVSTPGGAGPTGAQLTTMISQTAPASLTKRLLSSAATDNATLIRAGVGTVRQISGFTARGTPVFLKLYDKATAPTVGTDVPRKTYYLPGNSAFVFDCNDSYALGIGYGMTTAAADNSTAAVAADDVICLNVDYV